MPVRKFFVFFVSISPDMHMERVKEEILKSLPYILFQSFFTDRFVYLLRTSTKSDENGYLGKTTVKNSDWALMK